MRSLIIGTRGSALARTQSEWVREQLGVGELKIISTRGDRLVDLPLQSNLEKGLFTKELEVALLAGDVDLAVHSLKDLPVVPPQGLALSATPVRAPVADLLIWRRGESIHEPGRRIGSSSARRVALLRAAFPEHRAVPLRGNVPTRLAKLQRGEADAIILAEAGVVRLGFDLEGFEVARLDPTRWIPAAGQGALGLEHRADDQRIEGLLAAIHHNETAQAVRLERAWLDRFGGGCHAAVGAYAHRSAEGWSLHLGAARPDETFAVLSVTCSSPSLDQMDELIDAFANTAEPLGGVELEEWLR